MVHDRRLTIDDRRKHVQPRGGKPLAPIKWECQLNNRAVNSIPVVRPKRLLVVCMVYAICGFASYAVAAIDLALGCLFATFVLLGLGFWYSKPQTACLGAVSFCWTPWAVAVPFAACGFPECEWGPEFLLYVYTIVAAIPTLPAVLLASGSAWFVSRHVRIGYPPGTCTQCGYDLRGLAHHRCPECGFDNSAGDLT